MKVGTLPVGLVDISNISKATQYAMWKKVQQYVREVETLC